ncbi:MAG: tryptophan--tRNA ligase, partial [bacterium]|nr:tryptophan--tRNA ligase [bacterium]
ALHKIFSTPDEVSMIDSGCRTAEIGCVDCKKILLGHAEPFICPFREKFHALKSKPSLVYDAAKAGAEKCRPLAIETIEGAKSRLGIRHTL